MNTTKQSVRVVEKSAFIVMGFMVRIKPVNVEVSQAWADLMAQADRIPGQVEPGIYYGAERNYDPATQESDYLAAVEVTGEYDVPEGLVQWAIPAQRYAVFATKIPQIRSTYRYIFDEWMPASEYERSDGPEFEFYGKDFDTDARDESTIYLYMPVRKK